MKTEEPTADQLWQAIETYLSIAYDGPPSMVVRSLLSKLRECTGPILECPAFAATGGGSSPRRTLRLGNRAYPHMKLVLEPSPDGRKYLFKADTHDRHICPAKSSAEYAAFQELMTTNQQLAEKIETAWAAQGLPTFKTYLQEDLARRASQGTAR
jgi:hypothetical protein